MSEETRGFTYLDLYVSRDDLNGSKITARISKNSRIRSVGSENTRLTGDPFATFAIDGFRGLGVISTEDLLSELLTRLTPEMIAKRLEYEFTFDQLIGMLRKKVR